VIQYNRILLVLKALLAGFAVIFSRLSAFGRSRGLLYIIFEYNIDGHGEVGPTGGKRFTLRCNEREYSNSLMVLLL